jgi:riboflavin synthase
MFTGIITDVGRVRARTARGDLRLEIETAYDPDSIAIGASIAVSGPCLTVVAKGRAGHGGGWFAVDISAETQAKSTAGHWRPGDAVNLERPLRIGDELGGHIVSGHIDGVAEIVSIAPEGDSLRFRFRAPPDLARFVAPKGSVALDGTSLTVNEAEDCVFGVNIIPHTQSVTTWGAKRPGDAVNLEVDTVARYVARLHQGAWTPR